MNSALNWEENDICFVPPYGGRLKNDRALKQGRIGEFRLPKLGGRSQVEPILLQRIEKP